MHITQNRIAVEQKIDMYRCSSSGEFALVVSNVPCNPAFIVAPTHLCCYGSAGFLSGGGGGGGGPP